MTRAQELRDHAASHSPAMTSDGTARVRDALDRLLDTHNPADGTDFLGAQFDAGLAWVHFPEGHGGLALSPALQPEIDARLAEAGAVDAREQNPLGHGMAAPTIVAHGTEIQRRRFLRPLFTGDEIWCQLFSEPGAGSDFAALSTRAAPDGDEWVVTGQKVWTTLAHIARRALLVARTDPSAQKHKGLTYFVVDMEAPGVEVRPLRQITGDAEFNEVYLTDVRVPNADRLGDVGEGWRVAMTTLMNERVSIGGAMPARGAGPIADALRAWKAQGGGSAVVRDRLARLWIEAEVLRLTNIRAAQSRSVGTPGPEGSIGKVATAELNQRITELTLDLLGPEGMLYDTYEMRRPEHALEFSTPQRGFLRMRANSIEGGTTEIMRNILGERVLGLPGDVRVDKDLPWNEVPRS
jgi:alkylation response protein AidB-like acyl-CoA dehydrogenase